MENEILKSYSFLDKVYFKPERANKGKRILKKVLLVLVVIIFLGGLLTGDSIFEAFKKIIIPLAIGLTAFNGTGSGYKQVPTTINFYKSYMAKIHNSIDRQDKLGNRTEQIQLSYDKIKSIEYDKTLQYINLKGGAAVTVDFGDKQLTNDYTDDLNHQNNKIYIPSEIEEAFFKDIKHFTGLDIIEK